MNGEKDLVIRELLGVLGEMLKIDDPFLEMPEREKRFACSKGAELYKKYSSAGWAERVPSAEMTPERVLEFVIDLVRFNSLPHDFFRGDVSAVFADLDNSFTRLSRKADVVCQAREKWSSLSYEKQGELYNQRGEVE